MKAGCQRDYYSRSSSAGHSLQPDGSTLVKPNPTRMKRVPSPVAPLVATLPDDDPSESDGDNYKEGSDDSHAMSLICSSRRKLRYQCFHNIINVIDMLIKEETPVPMFPQHHQRLQPLIPGIQMSSLPFACAACLPRFWIPLILPRGP